MSAAGDLSAAAQHLPDVERRRYWSILEAGFLSLIPFPYAKRLEKRWLCTRRSSFCWRKEWPLKLFSSSWRLFEQKLCSLFAPKCWSILEEGWLALICVDQNVWCPFAWEAARPALLPSALVTWWRVNFRTCGSHSSKPRVLLMVLAPNSKSTRSQLSIDAKHAGTRIDLLSSQPAKVGLWQLPSKLLQVLFGGVFGQRYFFFTRYFEKKKKIRLLRTVLGRDQPSPKVMTDARFDKFHFKTDTFCIVVMASSVRPDRSHSCVVMPKWKNGKYPVGLDLEQTCKEGSPWNGRQLKPTSQTALVRKRNPNEQNKNFENCWSFFFFQ